MKVISKILIAIGLFITVISNLATYYGLHTAVQGVKNSADEGIGAVARGMDSAYFWSFISLFGCLILVVDVVLAFIKSLGEKGR